ncbi:MAG: methyltransferase domain-containing protein [Bdellovibrionota bacterium]
MKKQKYLHGFDRVEQERLLFQADFLEPYVYAGIELATVKRLLEVGCGVGAQTQILLRRFPKLKVDGVDFSAAQLKVAKELLEEPIAQKRVRLFQQNVEELSLADKGHYEAAFLCWFLEHVPNPLNALKKVKQHLKSGAEIYCTEVFNQTLFVEPYSPAYMNYWFQFNDYQWSIKGHPFVGADLGNLLKAAGFVDIKLEVRPFHFDSRNPRQRSEFIDYFFDILLSAEKTLLTQGRVTEAEIKKMKKEVEIVKKTKDSVFFYAYIRATAKAP